MFAIVILYKDGLKICYNPCFIDIELVWQRNDAIWCFTYLCISRYQVAASVMAKFEYFLYNAFWKYFQTKKHSE